MKNSHLEHLQHMSNGFVSSMDVMRQETGKGPRNGGIRNASDDALMFSTQINTVTPRHIEYHCCYLLRAGLLEQAGLKFGDRVDIRFDPGQRVGHIRREDRGWALYRYGEKTSKHGALKIRWFPGFPSIVTLAECEKITVNDEGIMFVYPEATSFTEQARK